jgi:hypothetical protein
VNHFEREHRRRQHHTSEQPNEHAFQKSHDAPFYARERGEVTAS